MKLVFNHLMFDVFLIIGAGLILFGVTLLGGFTLVKLLDKTYEVD